VHFGSCRLSFDPFFYVFCISHLNMCIISVKLNKLILLNCDHQLGSHVHLIIEQIDLCFNWLFVNSSLPTWFIIFNQCKNYTCLPFFHYVFMQSSLYKCWGVLMWSWACWFVLIQLCTCFFLSQFSKFIFLSLGWFFFNLLSIVFLCLHNCFCYDPFLSPLEISSIDACLMRFLGLVISLNIVPKGV
jgi:hypothetical protein